jgi:flavin-binding protein dodecin
VKNRATSSAISSRTTIATLTLAVFTVPVGYGVVLPLLPYLIERLPGAGAGVAQVSRHTGLLTGVYKTVEITGSSKMSAEDAIRNAISTAAKTIRDMEWLVVLKRVGTLKTVPSATFR